MPAAPAIAPDQFTSFGSLLKYLRRRAGLTQRELSIATGYTESHISRLESGQRSPDTAMLAARFVPALGLDTEPAWTARLLALAEGTPAAAPGEVPAAEPAVEAEPAPEPLPPTPTNLPAELTSFVGRARELADIRRQLSEPATRLLTLGGAGGAGKTRLALRTAASLLADYPGGVWFVDLSDVAHGPQVAPALVATLGLLDQANRAPLAVAASFLKPRTALVVLDNCEHLVAVCAETAQALLQACPGLRLLATSREVLGVPGEQFYRVPSLLTPDPARLPPLDELAGYEAVRLFVERARATFSAFALTPANAQAVAEICWQLDGMPLALELAAARVQTLTVEQIAARLAEQGRFRLLTGGSRTAPTRQQTLQAMIEWSCNLLPEAERALLRRLAVFAGGWSLEAAEAVAGERTQAAEAGQTASDLLDTLTQLVNKSLVIAERPAGNETRYRMLETIRQYAREMLAAAGEAAPAQQRHLDWCLALAERAATHLRGPDQARWLDQLQAEYANLRAALAWSQTHAPAAGLRLATALHWFWHLRGHHMSGRRALEALLPLTPTGPAHAAARAQAHTVAGFLLEMLSLEEAAAERLRAALALSRGLGEAGRGTAAYALAYLMDVTPDLDEALAYGEESRRLFERLGDATGLAECLLRLANNARTRADWESTAVLDAAHLQLTTEAGDLDGQASAHVGLGKTAYVRGEHAAALAHFQQAYELYRRVGNQWGLSYVLIGIGRAALARGDLEQAGQRIEAARDLHVDLGHCVAVGISSFHLGRVAALQDDAERASNRYAEALTQFREAGAREQMLAALFGLAHAAQERGNPARAREHYAEALLIARQIDHRVGLAHALRGLAALAAGTADLARAATLYAAAGRLDVPGTQPASAPLLATQDLFTVTVDQVLSAGEHSAEAPQALARLRAQLGPAALTAAWAAGEAMTLDEAAAYALA